MNPTQLPTTTSSSGQTTTQSPQTAGQPASAARQSASVQPGTASALLNGQGSVPLQPPPLSTVSLAPGTASSPAPPLPAKPQNLTLLMLPVALCLIAVVLFWLIRRSTKPAY